MKKNNVPDNLVLAITPFERPDFKLTLDIIRSGALAFLDTGRSLSTAEQAITKINALTDQPYGLRFPEGIDFDAGDIEKYNEQVKYIIYPSAKQFVPNKSFVNIVQAVSLSEALEAQQKGADAIIIKGNESGGRVGNSSSFILMQQVNKKLRLPFWVQGGMGPHSAAAAIVAGASGIVYDSQLSLFAVSQTEDKLKKIFKGLNGSETEIVNGYRYLRHGLLGKLDDDAGEPCWQLDTAINNDNPVLLAGQDIILASLFTELYSDIQELVYLTTEAIHGQLRMAKREPAIIKDSAFAKQFGLSYPVIQGPMTRVSDVPEFAAKVAEAGAMPSIALAVMKAEQASAVLQKTSELLQGKSWSAGILGFLPYDLLKPQLDIITAVKPPFVIIAGGRPEQVNYFSEKGITSFIHCPSPRLFSLFLKEGVTNFIFEGQECGGHVGPLSSMVLWEYQISLALEIEKKENISLVFAGGLHDKLSVAMLDAMTAQLSRSGIKIGILCGTAYLYTKEIVETQGILETYQQMAVSANETALIRTGPGHVTRCLKTAFVDHISEVKEQLKKEKASKEEIFIKLESMNVGHLRIASKGLMRVDGVLQKVKEKEQREKGMYMIGDIASLKKKVLTIEELHTDLTSGKEILQQVPAFEKKDKRKKGTDIAIVGIAGMFPGALHIEEYWSNILRSVDSITEVPEDRWSKELYFDPTSRGGANEKTYSKWGGFIPAFHFDPSFFGIPPQTLSLIEPSQLAALKVAYDVLADAGYTEKEFNKDRVSVVFGCEPGGDVSSAYGLRVILSQLSDGEQLRQLREILPSFTEDSFPGILGNITSGRITNRLDLGGQNFTIDAACASSLAAIDVAIKELLHGNSRMVIAGGVDMHNCLNDYVYFSSVHALSPRGKCHTFSKDADGMTLGEGVAAVLLKQYDDALADNDKIYAVIRGVGSSSDGRSLGLTAPRKKGQKRNLVSTYQKATVSPPEIGLVEAHGTGTAVGDKIELSSLEEIYQWSGADKASVVLGSVKSQVGHTKCTAGIAGLIKCIFSVQQGILPPTLNLTAPNTAYDKDRSSFYFLRSPKLWQQANRKAAVSSFGFGGTNYHLVVEKDKTADDVPASPRTWPFELFLFRGENMSDAIAEATTLLSYITIGHQVLLSDLSYSQEQISDKDHTVQIALIASSVADLHAKLTKATAQEKDSAVFYRNTKERSAPLISFLFAGQGSQFIGMGAELFLYFPETRNYLAAYPEYEKYIFPSAIFSATEEEQLSKELTDTRVAQPAIGLISLSIAHVLTKLGIVPGKLAGHSYGELTALCYAGAIATDALIPVSKKRATAIHATGTTDGAMLAVSCDAATIEKYKEQLEGAAIANINSPVQTVLSGRAENITAAAAFLQSKGIACKKIPVSHAFHSTLIAGAKEIFKKDLSVVSIQPPAIPVFSNLTAEPYSKNKNEIIETLSGQLISPVNYVDILNNIYREGATAFIEIGPGSASTNFVKQTITGKEITAIPTLKKDTSQLETLLVAVAKLAIAGVPVQSGYLYAHRKNKLLNLKDTTQLSKTMWSVNGRFAKPLSGAIPQRGFDPGKALINISKNAAASQYNNQPGDMNAINKYFESLDNFINVQKEIMLKYLDSNNDIAASNRQFVTQRNIPAKKTVTAEAEISIADRPTLLTKEIIEKKLKDLVSERTGYPLDMLDTELDIEADLGIDSIKRVELLSELSNRIGIGNTLGSVDHTSEEAVAMLEEVARLKSLRAIVEWLYKITMQHDPEKAVSAESVTGIHSTEHLPIKSREQVEKLIKEVISQRTGYPEDMLESDLDIEADLGIDSIKRIELLSEAGTRLGSGSNFGNIDQGSEEAVAMLEQVSRLKSIREIVDWIVNMEQVRVNKNNSLPDSTVVSNVSTAINSYHVSFTHKKISPAPAISFTGKTICLVSDDITNIEDSIRQSFLAGDATTITRTFDKFDIAGSPVINGIVCVLHKCSGWQHSYANFYNAFKIAKECDPSLLEFFTVVSVNDDAAINHAGYSGPVSGSGLNGFIASLQKEWPHVKTSLVLLHDPAAANTGDLILNEMATARQHELFNRPVAYYKGERFEQTFLKRQFTKETRRRSVELDTSSVIILVGGGRGITNWLANGISKKYNCNIIIIGKSDIPINTDASLLSKSRSELRQIILSQYEQKRASLRETELKTNKLFAELELVRNLDELKRTAGSVKYYATDVMNAEEVSATIEKVYREYGRIDGCVFGAGIINDKFIKDKLDVNVEKVFRTKADGAYNIITALQKTASPKFVILYSSLSASLGNRGQTDYAAANSVLDLMATYYNEQHETKYMSVNWGPWLGAGMIDDTLHHHLQKIGINGIEKEQGVDFLIHEIEHLEKNEPVILALSSSGPGIETVFSN